MYMFDTNTVSQLFRRHPRLLSLMEKIPPSAVCISSITQAELLYGVAKRQNLALKATVAAFLDAVTVYAWDSEAAHCYGTLRAEMTQKGRVMGALDQLIAAHAQSRGATIVTNDRAFAMVPGLTVEDWT
ncbi:VapC toxin family PIN domain ribonuclease [Serratia liquefaciens]|uniref:type II toxin-antitoxin system VapC family toxin n=1 Tax=Serratia liquefaciens TaxID=614 RepID=UPI00066166AE|nr:type II toxin-antitoxin system VapC family toxin [Serratia liquefaciens]AMH01059.1 PIN domain-containing protein [Serratia liquefaciens]RYM62366.1 VapC toxin family PIN domain ribonuclease [Serratia liquefaciens]CAI1198097.1 tRNA(fMet)-specific endonuclease VapC [Serratia liquefaciens]HBK4770121.1 type II toxin-antitoxin system VapC family toxin [Serratia liquefaciens]HEI8955714.1 type II toxin-antitoxin system VapC family toxin [Serratia liquefaciens]